MNTIDKIRAEIERRREANKRQYQSSAGGMSWQRMCGEEDCLVELLSFLDTLEEPDKDLEDAAKKYRFFDFGTPDEIAQTAFKAGAEWQEKRWENNRLMAQDHATEEECQREMDFVDNHIKKHHRIPTFSDAINYGIEWQKQKSAENGKELLYVSNKSYKIGYRDGKRDAEQKQKGGNK